MVERLDQQEIRDVRVHDAPSLSLKFLQRVGVEIAPYLLARERVLKNDARLIAAVFAFAGHNKTPPKIHCGIIPEGVIYLRLGVRISLRGYVRTAHRVGARWAAFYFMGRDPVERA